MSSTRRLGALSQTRAWLESSFAFLLAIAFDPWIQGAATSPRWAIAALSLWFMEWWLLPFAAFCFAVLDFDQAVHWAILSAALCWGLKADGLSLRRCIGGFSVGMAANGVIAGLDLFGWQFFPESGPAGALFVNKNIMGEAASVAFIASLVFLRGKSRLVFALACFPALLMSTSRAAWLGSAVGILFLLPARYRWLVLTISLVGGLIAFQIGFDELGVEFSTDSLFQRFDLWRDAVTHLNWFGNGSYDYSTIEHREPNLHNDWLQMLYEWGIIGVVPIFAIVFAGSGAALPFVAAVLVVGSFGFPLHSPASAWFIAFVIGYCLRLCFDGSRKTLRVWDSSQAVSRA